jgi:hypothetical protein
VGVGNRHERQKIISPDENQTYNALCKSRTSTLMNG